MFSGVSKEYPAMPDRNSARRPILRGRALSLGFVLATVVAGCGTGTPEIAKGPSAAPKAGAATDEGQAKASNQTPNRRTGLPSSSRREFQKKSQQEGVN
jgi:hypothetical protein